MSRRTPVALAAAAMALMAPGAQAAHVDQARVAVTSVTIALEEGQELQLLLMLRDGDALRVETALCDAGRCGDARPWTGPVSGSSLDPSSATAHLRTSVGRVPLEVWWEPGDEGRASVGALSVRGDDQGHRVATWAGDSARVRVRLGAQTCTGHGGVGTHVQAVEADGDHPSPLSRLRLPAGTLGCPAGQPLV